jgi:ABC-type transport system substrate-binding protein
MGYMGYKNNFRLVIISATLLVSLEVAARQSAKRPFYETMYFIVNTTSPPFDSVVIRYSLAMATDRRAIAGAMREEGFRYFPGIGLVPPYGGYEIISHLEVAIDGKTYDVLAYNPTAARNLLARAGFPEGLGNDKQKLTIEILVYTGEDTDKLVSIVKQQ